MKIYTQIKLMRLLCVVLPFAVGACAGIDQNGAKSLATAGQAASQALGDQATAVGSALNDLPTTVTLKEIMSCQAVTKAATRQACVAGAQQQAQASSFETPRKQLVAIAAQRAKAMGALNSAYKAFGDFASYDAGQAAATAIATAVSSVNDLTKSLAAVAPQAAAIPAITATVSKALEGGVGFLAQQRQAELMLAASRDLHAATDAMIKAVTIEEDETAMKSLIQELEDERDKLELATFQAGLVSPTALMTPFYAKDAPDITLVNPTHENSDLAAASAEYILQNTTSARAASITDSYDKAIDVLTALSAEHGKLESKQRVDVSWIITEAQYVENLVKSANK